MNKTKNPHEIRKIRTYDDLKNEKARLTMEITITEQKIKISFNRLIDIFTFRNVFHAVSDNLSSASPVFMKILERGKGFFGKHKKKKKKDTVPTEE
ncbi:MAG: hypothetical protein Q8867_06680 [Bacteroidota bacterium]|nr:hypothetical protein [Bacteroidota bacterium]